MINENVHVTAVCWLIYLSILGLTPILTKPCVSSNHLQAHPCLEGNAQRAFFLAEQKPNS